MFQQNEKKQKVHILLQFQPICMSWFKLQNTCMRSQCENVMLIYSSRAEQGGRRGYEGEGKSISLCHDMLDTLQKQPHTKKPA